MQKIKVIQFIHGMSTGGAEVLVKDYLKFIDKKEFNLTLLCLRHFVESPYEETVRKMGIKVIYVEDFLHFKSGNYFVKVINYIEKYRIVRKIIREEKPDVIHSHLCVNSYVKYARPPRKTFIVHTVHNEPKRLWKASKKLQLIARRRDFKAAKYLVKKYKMKFIVLHDEMKKEVNELFSVSDSIILNNGVDTARFNSARPRKKIRKSLGIKDDAYVVGHIGRFHKQKNHSFLVEIFKEIKKKKNHAFLLMVGEGKEKRMVEELLDSYKLHDYSIILNRDDIPDILKAMDVFVFPSIYEGLGVALIEAQEAKIPCFISERVPQHAIISNQTKQLTLNMGPKEWAEEILNYKKPNSVIIDDDRWDIKKITKELERIYVEGVKQKTDE